MNNRHKPLKGEFLIIQNTSVPKIANADFVQPVYNGESF